MYNSQYCQLVGMLACCDTAIIKVKFYPISLHFSSPNFNGSSHHLSVAIGRATPEAGK